MRDELISLVKKIDVLREVGEILSAGSKGLNIFGLADPQKGCFLSALAGLRKNNGPLVFVLPGRDEVRNYRRELNYFYHEQEMLELYPENLTQVRADAKNQEVAAARVMALRAMHAAGFSINFVTAEALLQRLPTPEAIFNSNLLVKVEEIVEFLHAASKGNPEAFEKSISDLHAAIDKAVNKVRSKEHPETPLVGQVDALTDLLYLTYGSFVLMGVDPKPFFDTVHEANMGKIFPDGKAHFDPVTHKILKPDDWEERFAPEPAIKRELDRQIQKSLNRKKRNQASH